MIVYTKLGDYLKSINMKYIDLQRKLNLSPSIVAKFQKNRPVTTETLDKICSFLEVQPGEIMEWIPDEEYAKQELDKKNLEKLALEKQIAELQAKLNSM